MTDEQLRRAIGDALLRAFAARKRAPRELVELVAQLDAVPAAPRR